MSDWMYGDSYVKLPRWIVWIVNKIFGDKLTMKDLEELKLAIEDSTTIEYLGQIRYTITTRKDLSDGNKEYFDHRIENKIREILDG